MNRRARFPFRAALASAALTAACAAGLPAPTTTHLSAARQHDAHVTLADLERGRTLYVSKCGGCHALRDPASLPPEGWAREVGEMREKQGVTLSEGDSEDIVRYLGAVSLVASR